MSFKEITIKYHKHSNPTSAALKRLSSGIRVGTIRVVPWTNSEQINQPFRVILTQNRRTQPPITLCPLIKTQHLFNCKHIYTMLPPPPRFVK